MWTQWAYRENYAAGNDKMSWSLQRVGRHASRSFKRNCIVCSNTHFKGCHSMLVTWWQAYFLNNAKVHLRLTLSSMLLCMLVSTYVSTKEGVTQLVETNVLSVPLGCVVNQPMNITLVSLLQISIEYPLNQWDASSVTFCFSTSYKTLMCMSLEKGRK